MLEDTESDSTFKFVDTVGLLIKDQDIINREDFYKLISLVKCVFCGILLDTAICCSRCQSPICRNCSIKSLLLDNIACKGCNELPLIISRSNPEIIQALNTLIVKCHICQRLFQLDSIIYHYMECKLTGLGCTFCNSDDITCTFKTSNESFNSFHEKINNQIENLPYSNLNRTKDISQKNNIDFDYSSYYKLMATFSKEEIEKYKNMNLQLSVENFALKEKIGIHSIFYIDRK